MSEPLDTSPEAQMRRNLASDMRFTWGCQLGMGLFALLGLVPLALLYPFTDSVSAVYLASVPFNAAVALVAYRYRQNAQDRTLRRSTAGWLAIIASCGVALYLLLWFGRTSGL